MEDESVKIQVLLELALQQAHEGSAESIISKALPLYMRKLNCFLAGVVSPQRPPVVIPLMMANDPLWLDSLRQLLSRATSENDAVTENIIKINKNIENNYKLSHLYIYPLARFGWLVLGKKQPFSKQIKFELKQVVSQLGRALSQAAEEERLKLFQNLINHSSDAIQVSTENGNLFYINEIAANRLGICQEEAHRYKVQDFEEIFQEDSHWQDHLRNLKARDYLTMEGVNIHQQTGEKFPVEVTVKYIRIGDRGFVIANSRDISARKIAEYDLRETKQQLESIFNEMEDVVWSVKLPEYKMLFVTPSVEKLYGISIENWMQDSHWWERAIHPDDAFVVKRIMTQLEKQGHYAEKYRILTQTGDVKWVFNRGKLVFDDQNAPIRLDGIVMDRTQQYAAEEMLQQEVALQKILISVSSTYININLNEVEATIQQSLHDLGTFVQADRAYIFDYDFEHDTTSNTYEWCAPGISPEIDNLQAIPVAYFPQWVEKHRLGEPFYIPDVQALPHEGEGSLREILEPQGIKSLITFPMIDGAELIGFVGFDSVHKYHEYTEKERKLLFLFAQMLINVRNRQRWEQQLTRQEAKFRNIIANMNLGLMEVDNDDTVLFANQSFCEMSGYCLDELKGKKASAILLSPTDAQVAYNRQPQRKIGIADSYEIQVLNKKGEKRWWFVSGAPNINDKGQLTGTIGIHLDITDQKKLEQELAEAKTFAEQAAKAKELFLANMSHEIRTPLNVIIGMIRQLGKEELARHQVFYVNQAGSAAKHLLTILNNILDMSKIESGELSIENQEFSMSALAYNVHSILFSQAKEKGLDFRLWVSPDVSPALIGDEVRIRQVLINLLGNAIKFTESGFISLTVESKTTDVTQQTLLVAVEDSGIGMSPAFIARIFDKFSQEQDTSSRKFEGTGLGMAISRDLIRLMGSDLAVCSTKGEGTKISFDLKLPIGAADRLVGKSAEVKQDALKGSHILLAEDNEMNRFIACQSLAFVGCTVAEAVNGLEAVKKVKAERFDLILMDIQMPEMDGLEATRVIRNELQVHTPIIALTANAFKHDIDLYLANGMNDYLTKPYDEQEFFRKLEHYLKRLALASAPPVPAKTPPKPDEPLYDLTPLRELSRGKEEFVQKMIDVFVKLVWENTARMETALQEGDLETVRRTAHKIKPSLDQMGIVSLKEKIRILEKFPESPTQHGDMKQLADEVCAILRQVVAELERNELKTA